MESNSRSNHKHSNFKIINYPSLYCYFCLGLIMHSERHDADRLRSKIEIISFRSTQTDVTFRFWFCNFSSTYRHRFMDILYWPSAFSKQQTAVAVAMVSWCSTFGMHFIDKSDRLSCQWLTNHITNHLQSVKSNRTSRLPKYNNYFASKPKQKNTKKQHTLLSAVSHNDVPFILHTLVYFQSRKRVEHRRKQSRTAQTWLVQKSVVQLFTTQLCKRSRCQNSRK